MPSLGTLLLLLLVALSPQQSSAVPPPDTPENKNTSPLPPPDTPENKVTVANAIFSSLEQAILYLNTTPKDVKTGTMMFLRILQVQLEGAQEAWTVNSTFGLRARALSEKLEKIANRYFEIYKEKEAIRMQGFQPVVQAGFWKLPLAWSYTNTSNVKKTYLYPDYLLHEYLIPCLLDVLGTSESEIPCRQSGSCPNEMANGEHLTFQLLYFLFSRMIGCTEGVYYHTQYYMKSFCSHLMFLNLESVILDYSYSIQRLFLRNILLCGIGGFVDFYKIQWLQIILNWQNPQKGCYKPDIHSSNPCSIPKTVVAAGAIGGFLYVLAKDPEAMEVPFQLTPSPTILTTPGKNIAAPAIWK